MRVVQEDRWNLMESNGYGFEVKVSRRAESFFSQRGLPSYPQVLRRVSRYEAYEVATLH